jgi:hypothetical protein
MQVSTASGPVVPRPVVRRRTAFRRLTAALLALLPASSCMPGDAGAGAAVVRDTVVEHRGTPLTVPIIENGAEPETGRTWRLDPLPIIDIGGSNAPPNEALHRVAGAVRLSDGLIVVADAGSSSLRVFDANGSFTALIGGPGEGPGEFRSMHHFARLPGDSLLIYDLQLGRVTLFDDNGRPSREFRIGASAASPPGSVTGVLADGSLVVRGFIDLGGRSPSGLERMESWESVYSPEGTVLDTLGRFGSEAFFVSIDRGFTVYELPFARISFTHAAGDRLWTGDSSRPEIRALDPTGQPRLILRWQAPSRPIDAAARDAALAHARRNARDDNARRDLERIHGEMNLTGQMPAFSILRGDEDGNLWVQDYRTPWDEGPSTWRIFDPEGVLIATAMLPARFAPSQIGSDYVLGTWRDELDVEHVQLYALQR